MPQHGPAPCINSDAQHPPRQSASWQRFSAFVPTVLSYLRRMPILKRILDLPAFKAVISKVAPADRGGGAGSLPV
ncbi:hypothetical protein D9Q98_005717 [Chlorella vulgaris]|uniref:Uncharacterized protein n=1 Tax=Chlorella vulgaris TaxID=3077 RepID=A0A9D4TMH8_CHLVU|nr:hypothetical protein D9Q98_005717 [Chlorella vulgaris]